MNSNATIGNANVGGVLSVTGNTTLSNVFVNANANIGNTNVRGVLTVTGTTTLSNVTVNSNATIGNASIGGLLTVTGLTTLNGNILLSNVYLQQTSNISTTPTILSYPLYQTYNITSSSNSTITLPNIANGGNIVGITLNFFKSGSATTVITIQSAGTDLFITNGTVTQSSTYTIPSGVTSSMLIACAGTPNYWTAIGGGGGGGSGSAGSFANIAVNKSSVDSGYVMDINGNAKITGNLVIGNGVTVSSGTVSFPSGSIETSAIASGFVDTSTTQNIGGAKTFSANVTVSSGFLLPVFPTNTTCFRIGGNTFANSLDTTENSIAFGNNAMQGSTNISYDNKFIRCIAIGNNAMQFNQYGTSNTPCNDNVVIGYNAANNSGYNFYDNVIIGSQACGSGTFQGLTDSVIIGSKIGQNTQAYYERSVIIGALNFKGSGSNDSTVVGYGNFLNSTFGYANGAIVFGPSNLQNSLGFNRMICIGGSSLTNLNNTYAVICIGSESLIGLTSCGYVTSIGSFITTTNGSLSNTTIIGTNSSTNKNNVVYFGGNDSGVHQDLLPANKNKILTNQSISENTTLEFEMGEHINITSSSVTTVTLPSTIATKNVGSRFCLFKNYTTAVSVTISSEANGIRLANNAVSNTLTWGSSEQYITLICVSTTSPCWIVTNSQTGGSYVDLSTTQTIGGAKTFSTAPVMSGANISSGTIPTSAVASGFADTSTTQTIGGAKTFSTAPVMSGANISSGTIPTTSLGFTFVDMSNAQTVGGAKTFSVAPVMSGANISSGTIPIEAVADGFVETTKAQTIAGKKTFTIAPVMSGANISSGTIPTTSLGFTFVDMSNTQTIGGAKTFSVAPVMSGANISSGTIPTSAVASGFVDTSTTQNIGGAKTFSVSPVMSGANISSGTISTNSLGFTFVDMSNAQTIGGAKTFSGLTTLTGGLTASGTQTITFGTNAPTMSGANISSGTIPTSAVASGFADTSTTQTIGGAKTFSVSPVMSGANISSGTIPTTSLGFTFVDMSNTQTIGGAKTFSVAPVMSGANISSGTIPTSAVASGFVDTSTTQNIGGAKTFSVAPVMSGANISSGTIPTTSLGFTFVDMSNTQTVGGAKTFSVAPIMSGANISSGTIPTTSLGFTFVDMSNAQTVGGAKTFSGITTFTGNITANSLTVTPTQLSFLNAVSTGKIGQSQLTNGYVDLSNDQSISGIKTFSGNVNLNGNVSLGNINLYQIANISTTTPLSYPLSQTYNITSTSDTIITLPTIASGTSIIGDVINFYKSGSATILVTIQSSGSTDKFVTNGTITQATTFTIPSGTTSASLIACAGTPNYWTAIGGGSSSTFSNIAINKSSVDAGYVLDVSGNTKVAGNILVGNGLTVSSGSVSFPSGSIATSAIASGFVDTSTTQNSIAGAKTFTGGVTISTNALTVSGGLTASGTQTITFGTNAPTMSGANISSGSIPNASISGGCVDTTTAQNSIAGAKTFTGGVTISTNALTVSGGITASGTQTITFGTNAPTMSGANIALRTIPDGALSTNIPLENSSNEFTGLNSFSNITTFTGIITANSLTITPTQLSFLNAVSAAKIGQSQITNGYVDLSTAQNSIAGAKTFTGGVTISGGLTASGTQTITFGTNAPTMSGANISSGTIPNGSISGGCVDTSTTQNSIAGAKTFTGGVTVSTNPLTVSGGITASGTQTITFGTNAPTMSGANISSNSIPKTSIIDANSFSTGINVSGFFTSSTNALVVTGNASISGNVTAVSYNATSDRRLKANIQPLRSQWDSILSVEPVSFDWTVDGRTDIGFIAQDVYKSYPHLKPNYKTADPSFNEEEPVDLSGNPMYYTIDYGRMTPFLWQGMKEIMQKLDRLETENKKLVERIAVLESK